MMRSCIQDDYISHPEALEGCAQDQLDCNFVWHTVLIICTVLLRTILHYIIILPD